MKTSILVFRPDIGGGVAKTRTIKAKHGTDFFTCAWCRLHKTRPLTSFIVKGTEHEFQTIVCYCDNCQLATIVEMETEAEKESEV